MIETPIALLHAEEICAAHERLTVIVMGTNDVVNETFGLHVPGRNPLVLTALSLSLLAARAAGKVIIDGVYNDVKNLGRLRRRGASGSRDGLRRQDADPSRPGRAGQRCVRAVRRPTSSTPRR